MRMTVRTRARAAAAAGLLAMAGLLAGGCTEDEGQQPGGEDGDAGEISPFTGLETDPGPEPVLAVKIDNAEAARPQTGLAEADIVYAEQVEAGLSRFLAVYSSGLPDDPDTIGPVRSGRESDLELLEQFGDPAFAYSGIQGLLEPLFDEATMHPVSPAVASEAYERDDDRPAPHNLYADPDLLLDAAPEASEAADIGFRFGDAPAGGGKKAQTYTVNFPSASFTFIWSADDGAWRVSLDGEETDAAPATVVVQHVTVRDSDFHDSGGVVTPYTETTGSGTAVVLRDGRAYQAEWSRPSAEDGTEFTTPEGEPMPFAPGPVWVVLAE